MTLYHHSRKLVDVEVDITRVLISFPSWHFLVCSHSCSP